MTVPPLTERLKDAAAHAGAKYLTALLLETAEAVEFATEKIASLSQSAADLDTARQAAEARVKELEAKQRIDEAQCDEMTDRAGRYLQRAQAAEATVATLRDRIEREASKAADRCHKQRERAEAAEARVAVLERTLKGFARLDFQLRDAEKFERRYGIHIGGDSALGAVFAWIDELCAQARDVLAGTDGGER